MLTDLILRLFKTLFGCFAALVFALTLVITSVCYVFVFALFPEKKSPVIAHSKISRTWATLLFRLFGIRVKVLNKEVLDPQAVYVFVANHRSLLDVPAYAIACKNTFRFLAKKELTRIPLLGYIINKLYISVDRTNKQARVKSMENMMNSLKDGISVFLCPEGTRNSGPEPLLPFHDGAFRLAISAQVPLAVMTIRFSDKLLSPKRPVELSPGTLECVWSKPIVTKGMTENDIPKLRAITIELMTENLRGSL